MKYNNLEILEENVGIYKCGVKYKQVRCLCDCGNVTFSSKYKVINGITKSCGCLQDEQRKNFGKRIRLKKGKSAQNQVYGVYRKAARRRGYCFELTMEEFLTIVAKPCIYCGNKLKNRLVRKDGYGDFKYTGIDRYENNKGYTVENSVPCCSTCNRMKTNMDINDFKKHLLLIIDNSIFWQRTA